MMRKMKWRTFMAVPIFLGMFFFAGLMETNAATIYGVTSSNQLVRFGATSPGNVTTVGAITGLQSGENVLGIDFRPATGQLYALGSNSRIYTINKKTGAATLVGHFNIRFKRNKFRFRF